MPLATSSALLMSTDPETSSSWLMFCKVYLFACAGFAVLVSAILGFMLLAGNTSENAKKAAVLVGTGILVLHTGYLAAPFVIGKPGSGWTIWAMVPIAVFVIAGSFPGLRYSLADPKKLLDSSLIVVLTFELLLYAAPPLLVYLHRPSPAAAAPLRSPLHPSDGDVVPAPGSDPAPVQ